MAAVIKAWRKKWLKNGPEKTPAWKQVTFQPPQDTELFPNEMFFKSFPWGVLYEQLKISTASKLTFGEQRAISGTFPVVSSPFPPSKLRRIFDTHILGTSLDKSLNIELKPDLELAKEREWGGRQTRR